MYQQPWKTHAFVKLKHDEMAKLVEVIGELGVPPLGEMEDAALVKRLKEGLELIRHKQQPTVFDRLDEISVLSNIPLDGTSEFSYSWYDSENTGAGY